MVRYLTVDDVLRMSEAEVGPDMLRDFGLLESAVMRPQATFGGADLYTDVASKAAALFFSLARNHAFIDGNKRVAVIALESFLLINGFELLCDDGAIVGLALDASEGIASTETIAGFIKSHVSAIPEPEYD